MFFSQDSHFSLCKLIEFMAHFQCSNTTIIPINHAVYLASLFGIRQPHMPQVSILVTIDMHPTTSITTVPLKGWTWIGNSVCIISKKNVIFFFCISTYYLFFLVLSLIWCYFFFLFLYNEVFGKGVSRERWYCINFKF